MGFFDKVKNMFTEEVEDEVKVEQVKKEVTHVSIDAPSTKIEEEANNEFKLDEEKFSKPIFFDDNDFEDLNLTQKKQVNTINTYEENNDIYGIKKEIKKEEKKVFKPTPIISPVYGVLDKNYHKEDIVSKPSSIQTNQNMLEEEPSIETIRNKAYGTLEDELENTLFGTNSILFKQFKNDNEETMELEKFDDDTLNELTDNISKELDELLEKKDKYITEEQSKEVDEDLLDFIDSTLYKENE